jgi:hypothetical protein
VRRRRHRPLRALLVVAVLGGLGWWGSGQLHLRAAADAGSVVRAAASAAGADGSIAVVVRGAAGAPTTASANAREPRYTASLAKLFVVQQLLEASAEGRVRLTAADRSRLRRAISLSDDAAMNRLWVAFDGAGLVRSAAREFGLPDTAPPAVRGQWGQTRTTAADLADFLAHLSRHLRADDLAALTGWMRAAAAHGADGFDQAFGLRSPDVDGDHRIAVKQGWMCCVAGTRQLHSVGILPDGTVVVLLGQFREATSWDTARGALDRAAEGLVAAVGG